MFELTARDDAWIAEAPRRCVATTTIEADPHAVWSVLTDHMAWPAWFPSVREVIVSEDAAGVGCRRRVRLTGMELEEEFIVWDPPHALAFTAVSSSRRLFDSIAEHVTLEPVGEGATYVTYVQAFAPVGWFRVPFVVVRPIFGRDLRRAMRRLAAALQQSSSR